MTNEWERERHKKKRQRDYIAKRLWEDKSFSPKRVEDAKKKGRDKRLTPKDISRFTEEELDELE